MTINASDAAAYPLTNANKEKYIGSATFTITAAGAIDSTSADDAKIAGDTFASGVCALTFPACSRARILIGVVSDGTVTGGVLTAFSPTAGTATIKTTDGGAAAEPESGAKIMVRIFGEINQ